MLPKSGFHQFTALLPRPHTGVGKGRKSLRVGKGALQDQRGISSEKAALLWMYGRGIADFDSPSFSQKLGQIIADATSNVRRKAG
jgi:molybdopterin/thiamine biosynthesis adenylyltransferase